MAAEKTSIAVIGAGIGGLTAAASLLRAISIRADRCTGTSAGFRPKRMRPVYIPARRNAWVQLARPPSSSRRPIVANRDARDEKATTKFNKAGQETWFCCTRHNFLTAIIGSAQ